MQFLSAMLRKLLRPRTPSPEEKAREAQRRFDTQKQAEDFFIGDGSRNQPIDYSKIEHWRNDVTEDG